MTHMHQLHREPPQALTDAIAALRECEAKLDALHWDLRDETAYLRQIIADVEGKIIDCEEAYRFRTGYDVNEEKRRLGREYAAEGYGS